MSTTKPPRLDRHSKQAMRLLANGVRATGEQLRHDYQAALARLQGHWDTQLRAVESQRDQVLEVLDLMLLYGTDDELRARADELSVALHARQDADRTAPQLAAVLQ